ncbi:hypothetical protein BX616_000205 [Lobosporangium transversale]|nr:hypothetical protein BX616_000205 [Lobosporangium transversale]
MKVYFALVIAFSFVQGIIAVKGFLSGMSWVQNTLDLSWENAYENDPDLIKELQKELQCQGFKDSNDRSLEQPLGRMGDQLPPCIGALESNFGKKLQEFGTFILYIRLIQLVGVIMLSIIFKYLAVMGDEEDQDEEEALTRQMCEKSGYYWTTKQVEDANAQVPLLSVESMDEDALSLDEYGDDSEHALNGQSLSYPEVRVISL